MIKTLKYLGMHAIMRYYSSSSVIICIIFLAAVYLILLTPQELVIFSIYYHLSGTRLGGGVR